MRGRILVVDHRTPTPDQDSGSESAFFLLKILRQVGYDITFAPFNLAEAGHYTLALNGLGIKTVAAPHWPSINAVVEALAPQADILLFYRAPIAAQLLDIARRAAPAAKILFHTVDLHFLRMERAAALSGDPAEIEGAQLMRKTELDVIERADATIVVSDYELGLLRGLLPQAVVRHVPIFRQSPSLLSEPDVERIYRSLWPGRRRALRRWLDGRASDLQNRRDFLFIGGFDHLPNVDAVHWFVREVWPLLQAKGYSNRFVIVGSRMPPELSALASDAIDVRGYVKSLMPLFAGCRLSVAPLRFGGGIKGKIITSLSYGVPVVATSIAAEGMDLRHDENILVADTPDQFADQILRLYRDDELWHRLSSNGYRTFHDKFSLTAVADNVLAVFDGLMESAAR